MGTRPAANPVAPERHGSVLGLRGQPDQIPPHLDIIPPGQSEPRIFPDRAVARVGPRRP